MVDLAHLALAGHSYSAVREEKEGPTSDISTTQLIACEDPVALLAKVVVLLIASTISPFTRTARDVINPVNFELALFFWFYRSPNC